jgi:hypothetical protein
VAAERLFRHRPEFPSLHFWCPRAMYTNLTPQTSFRQFGIMDVSRNTGGYNWVYNSIHRLDRNALAYTGYAIHDYSHNEENNHRESEEQQLVLNRRCRLGTLCGWTGMERKWAISLATAIDGVMNTLPVDLGPKTSFHGNWNSKLAKRYKRSRSQ